MRYLLLTLRHKWFVLRAGLRTKAPLWRLIIHDLSKFLPSELVHYQRQFFGGGDPDFATAWLKHQNRNPHHWEYWIQRGSKTGPLPMPEWAVREMIADWLAACRAYEGYWPTPDGDWPWLESNLWKTCPIHEDTDNMILDILEGLGWPRIWLVNVMQGTQAPTVRRAG